MQFQIILSGKNKKYNKLSAVELAMGKLIQLYLVGVGEFLGCMQFNAKTKQEAHGPRVAHLSDIATADMQMLCNILPVLSSQLMKRSTFKQFLILKKNIIYGMTVNGA